MTNTGSPNTTNEEDTNKSSSPHLTVAKNVEVIDISDDDVVSFLYYNIYFIIFGCLLL